MKPLESEVQAAICEYLTLRRAFFWRQNTSPVYDTKQQVFRRMPKFALPGVPDIILIQKGGIVCFLEVKRPGGHLDPNQVIFKDRCQALGAAYHLVTSVEEVMALGL